MTFSCLSSMTSSVDNREEQVDMESTSPTVPLIYARPENEMGELLADLQLKPIKFDTRFNNEKCRDEFRKFERDSKPIWEKIRTRGLADLSSELKKLDQSLFLICY